MLTMFITSIISVSNRNTLYSTVFYVIIFSGFYANSLSKKNDFEEIYYKSYTDESIQGKVLDANTGKGIPFCNLTIANTYNCLLYTSPSPRD